MLSRLLIGCSGILIALFQAPQQVDAGSVSHERLQPSRSVRWTQGGCQISRPVSHRVPSCRIPVNRFGNQIRYFCVGGIQKRRLPCGTVERWIAPHSRMVTRKVKVPGGYRTEVRYRNECHCGVTVRVPYTVRVPLPARCELRREKVHVPGRWVAEKRRQHRQQNGRHGRSLRF